MAGDRNFPRAGALAAAALFLLPVAGAYGLLEGFELARINDAQFQSAQAEREAGEANSALGRSQLLPVLSATVNRSKITGSDTEPDIFGDMTTSSLNYMSHDAAVQLRQPLFNMQRWAAYQQGKAKAEYSAAIFSKKEHDLAVRYLGSYLSLLLSQKNIELGEAKLHALNATRTQAQKQLEQGDGTVTDIYDAEARMSMAEAELIEARNQLLLAQRTLSTVTGVPSRDLAEPVADIGHLLGPDGEMADWLNKAMTYSPEILAASKTVDIAEQELKKARAGNYPTLDLVASKDLSSSSSVSTLNQKITQNAIGVEINIPLFNGGYNLAQTRQAAAQYRQAQADLDNARQQVELEVSRQFYGVSNGARKVAALQKAVSSAEETVKATSLGLSGGVKTLTDVLNSEEQLYQSRRDLVLAQYNQLVSWIALRADSGALNPADLVLLDGSFTIHPKSE